jgi:hypothetical protein
MNIKCVNITDGNKETLHTELLYSVTEARALGFELLKISFAFDDMKHIGFFDKCLKSIKKEGLIQLFVSSNDLKQRTTGAEYLYNLYSDLELIEINSDFRLIKL